jgi:glutamate--cysteine ligase
MTNRLTRETLLSCFHNYGCEPENFRIGGEYERTIVRPNGKPVSYAEPLGIRWFLTQFMRRWGWKPKSEDGNIIALTKDGASLTLEPGGQFELSGAPHSRLSALAEEFALNRAQVNELAQEAGFTVITCGLTPICSIEDISWMPKGRYQIMKSYLPKKGDLAQFMMKATTSVQCNYDFIDEADCASKVKLCVGLAPITTAMFANSPLYRNRPNGFQSFRGHIWSRTDSDRTGFPMLQDNFSFERWIDYLLDVPMMFYRSGDTWLPANGRSFRYFMASGFDGIYPTMEDWDLHMTSVFPEVRIKRTIEVRGADCVSNELALAFCSLFTGLLYDSDAFSRALEVVEAISTDSDQDGRFQRACRLGLEAPFAGKTCAVWANLLVEAASDGLSRWEPDSVSLLDPLREQIDSGRSPAVALLKAWKSNPNPSAVIQYLSY